LVDTYCQASEEIAAWVAQHGGFKAIVELLANRARLRTFESLYGPLLTDQPDVKTVETQ